MTFYNETRNAGIGLRTALAATVGSVISFFAGIADSMRRYQKFTQTYDELNRLSQRELDDLGIDRSMITRVAMDAAYKD